MIGGDRDLGDEGGTFVVGTIAVVLLVTWLWYLDRYGIIADERALTLPAEVLEAVNVVVIAGFVVALLYGTYWLAGLDLSERAKWRAGLACAAGYVGAVAVVAFLQAHWLLDEVSIPAEVLVEHYLVGVGAGSLAGLLVGVNGVRMRRSRAEVETQRDAFAVVNEFLRHHVLNGMQVVLGNTDRLREDAGDADLEALADIEARSDAIATLVQRINAVMQTIAGDTELHPVDAVQVVEAEVEAARERHPRATFHVDAPESLAVRADRLLGDVLSNLFRNAVDHNDEGVSVSVSVSASAGAADEAETATIAVADDGTGVPDDRKREIFEAGEPGPRRVGRGFGLFMVRVLVEAYGGSVRVEDNEPAGARFVVELPRA